ncbi:MAG: radical SAM protein [Planctomycetes bacterium]|nr:radical SAM protein [Planctomycetota bacterium]
MHLYEVPYCEKTILYRPLVPMAFVCNKAMVGYVRGLLKGQTVEHRADVDKFLDSVGFWRPDEIPPALPLAEEVLPVQAVLLMTNRCSLRCKYCYASAGTSEPVDMSFDLARVVIDEVAENAAQQHFDSFGVTFHGGGEPTLNWDVLRRCVSYAKSKSVDCELSLASNGVWARSVRDFICKEFDSVSLSLDGVKSVQDSQRPRADGGGSFEDVMESISALDAAGVSYGIRMTVVPGHEQRLVEGVKLICSQTKALSIQAEPTFTVARGRYGPFSQSFADQFVPAFITAFDLAQREGVEMYYSGARPGIATRIFCRAALSAFVLNPRGRLVTCVETSQPLADSQEEFIVGHVDHNNVYLDRGALQDFLDKQQEEREACRECFCFWHCAGDCAVRRRSGYGKESPRCNITRSVSRELILRLIDKGKGVWNPLAHKNQERDEV